MLTAVKKNLIMIVAYFKLNLSASMEYRTSFLIQVLGMFLNNASFAFFWWLLFEKVGNIGGYGFGDVMLFSVTSSLIFTSVIVSFNTLAFHFGNVSAIANLAFEFTITLSIYPTIIYRGFIRFIIFTVLPAGFATMIPAVMVKAFNLKWTFAILGVTVVWLSIAFWSFNRGLRKYESGNLIVHKV